MKKSTRYLPAGTVDGQPYFLAPTGHSRVQRVRALGHLVGYLRWEHTDNTFTATTADGQHTTHLHPDADSAIRWLVGVATGYASAPATAPPGPAQLTLF